MTETFLDPNIIIYAYDHRGPPIGRESFWGGDG